jgi:Cu+-exporting ATPase
LDHIIKIVREGQTRRAPIERVADLLTGYFVPIVTAIAIVVWATWASLGLSGRLPEDYLDIPIGGWGRFGHFAFLRHILMVVPSVVVWSLEFAIAVFVIACPCGIGLAAPTALLVGSGLAANHGILARGGGEAFQEMAQVDIIVFDKTGTLTEGGEPRVTDHVLFSTPYQLPAGDIFGIASELESGSSHPLGIAIRQFCQAHSALFHRASAFEEEAGRGLKADFEDLQVTAIIGNEAWMEEHGITWDGSTSEKLEAWKMEAKSIVVLGIRDWTTSSFSIVAIFAVADQLRPEAPSVIARLHHQGIGTWMISGDNPTTAKAVARTAGIAESNVIAGVLPHEKVRLLLRMGGSLLTKSFTGREN